MAGPVTRQIHYTVYSSVTPTLTVSGCVSSGDSDYFWDSTHLWVYIQLTVEEVLYEQYNCIAVGGEMYSIMQYLWLLLYEICTLYTVHCAVLQYIVHCTMYSPWYSPLYSLLYSPLYSPLYTVQSMVLSIVQYIVHCTIQYSTAIVWFSIAQWTNWPLPFSQSSHKNTLYYTE